MNRFYPMLMIGLAVSALAAPPTRESKEHYDKGMVAYNTQDWPTAIRELKAAYQQEQRPEYLFALGQSQRISGDCESAIFTYKAFLRNSPTRQKAAVEGLIKTCQEEIVRAKEETERVEQQRALAAHHESEAVTAREVGEQPPPPITITPAAPQPVRWYHDPLGDTLALAAVAAVGVGGAFLALGDVAMSKSAAASTYGAYESAVGAARPQQVLGLGVLGAGLLCGAGAVWRYLTLGSSGPVVSAIPQSGGAALSVIGSF